MLYIFLGVLFVLWLLGYSMNVGGGLIHTLLVVGAVVLLFNWFSRRRSTA